MSGPPHSVSVCAHVGFSSIKAFPKVPFTVVVNPNSGPGGAPGSQPDAQTQGCLLLLKASGSNVNTVGYVRTNYTNRAVADVQADINAYANWTASYRPSGIFFDEATYDGAHASTYTSYGTYARNRGLKTVRAGGAYLMLLWADECPPSQIVVNPGTEVTSSAYFSADIVLSAERAYSDFSTSLLTINSTYPAAKQAVLLYNSPSSPSATLTTLSKDGIGWVYITDETEPNPYTGFPAYWTTELSQLSALN
jgi:hypothetical protein